ncbi:MAG: hypothetical protein LBS52_08610 [Dysgonamonadaceae bacterium]|nr:hypothetical protein [Dysgonamonadaceae bacterium]
MIFRFLILSDEADDFKREIKIGSDATFYDFFKAIMASTGYSDKEMTSFFICDDDWRKRMEITLVEMGSSSDEDSYVMEDCVLGDYLEDEKQKLMFVFDYMTERALYIELSEIIPGKQLAKPVISLSEGEAPPQFIQLEDIKADTFSSDLGETFYGDEGFNADELDREGFDGLDDVPLESGEEDFY